jgi:hypothetical protein
MFDRLLPRHADNTYHGYTLALWFFALLVALKLTIGLNCIFNGRQVAGSADGIPLDTFDPACARMVVSDFALWGLAQVMICVLCILVLVRYRALIPFMFVLLLLEHLGRKLILQVLPIVKTGTPPGFFVNLVLLALMVVGLALSLWSHAKPPARE